MSSTTGPLAISLPRFGKRELYRQLDAFFEREAQKLSLTTEIGLVEDDVLECMLRFGFTTETAKAIEMVPIVFVAWASDEVTRRECAATVRSACERLLPGHPKALETVRGWLGSRPDPELWTLWVRYIRCRTAVIAEADRAEMAERIGGQARRVARASGGLLGLGAVCDKEQAVINGIEAAFADSDARCDEAATEDVLHGVGARNWDLN